jgi:hypothetical protein
MDEGNEHYWTSLHQQDKAGDALVSNSKQPEPSEQQKRTLTVGVSSDYVLETQDIVC